jgi:secreted PhoX family phosphatase
VTTQEQPLRRRLLPLLDGIRHGSRSHLTCNYRCGNACDAPVPNETDNPYFGEVVQTALSRRSLFKGAGAGALVVTAGSVLPAGSAAAAEMTASAHDVRVGSGAGVPMAPPMAGAGAPLTFTSVPPNFLDDVVTAPGYAYDVLIRWGDPVLPDAPRFDPLNQSPAAQEMQFGYNCDFLAVLPLDGKRGRRALLVVNHEYTDEQLMFPGVPAPTPPALIPPTTLEQKRIAMAAHGLSVVEIERVGGRTARWRVSRRRGHNRRVTMSTPMQLTGPAAGSEYVRTNADPSGTRVLGTLNNCAGGWTPWGTTLHGEENFDQYFGPSIPITEPEAEPRLARYGISRTALPERRWDEVDPRFDVAKEPNEVNRFGWVVELDPHDPNSVPKKRTALGRFKHEGATVRIAEDGRVVAYSGDDERFDYIYKFVSKGVYDPRPGAEARAHNMTLLDEGDLYVGQFKGDSPPEEIDGSGRLPSDEAFDGTGRWIPLVKNGESQIRGKDVPWVLTFTRLAADRLGKELDDNGDFPDPKAPVVVDPSRVPTRMDRPEDIQPNPVNGRVYAALTNNSARTGALGVGADEANPRTRTTAFAPGSNGGPNENREQPGNRHGQVIEWTETDGVAGQDFYWKLFIVAGDPENEGTYFGGFDPKQVSPISCPDNVEFDPSGNLWISTDGNALSLVNQVQGTVGTSNDGLFAVPVAGPERGHLKQFLTVPIGAEACGPLVTADARSVFLAVQHPGETRGSTFDSPSSRWPDRNPTLAYPRPSVIVTYRRDGGRVGS